MADVFAVTTEVACCAARNIAACNFAIVEHVVVVVAVAVAAVAAVDAEALVGKSLVARCLIAASPSQVTVILAVVQEEYRPHERSSNWSFAFAPDATRCKPPRCYRRLWEI